MTRTSVTVTWLALIGFAAGIGFFVWTIVTSSNLNTCIACKRPVLEQTKTIVTVDGLKTILCCPACARTVQKTRRGSEIVVMQVTDFATGELVDARAAYTVIGSGVNPCMEQGARSGGEPRPVPKAFAECAPSIICFAELSVAQRFQAEHGGEVVAGGIAFAFPGG